MKRFEFQKREVNLDIAGQAFVLPLNQSTSDAMIAYGKGAQALAEALPDTAEGAEQAWTFSKNCLDALLGAGATEKIFTGREQSLQDITDVMTYIADAVRESVQAASAPTVKPVADRPAQDIHTVLQGVKDPETRKMVEKYLYR